MSNNSQQIISQNIDRIELDGRIFILVGTAHVSKQSVELVREVITFEKPDTVCIELCQSRYDSICNESKWKETDVIQVLKEGKIYVLGAQLALSSFQKKIANQIGVTPGAEMKEAIKLSKEQNAEISLVDRDVKTTLKRVWAKTNVLTVFKLIGALFGSLFTSHQVDEQEIEKLKSGDLLTELMSEFDEFLPGVKTALIDERDKYMAQKIWDSPGNKVVAVLGAGHIPGIKKCFGKHVDIALLEEIPPTHVSIKFLSWGIPIFILLLIGFGFYNSGHQTSIEMIKAWIIINGSLSALGAILALAHPITIVTAFIAAPITSLNPTIAAGTVCGLVEAFLRKPRVKDFETVGDDIATLKGLWHNRLARIFLVFLLTSVGSAIGTFLGAGSIIAML